MKMKHETGLKQDPQDSTKGQVHYTYNTFKVLLL
jgi:hypothetical protein